MCTDFKGKEVYMKLSKTFKSINIVPTWLD